MWCGVYQVSYREGRITRRNSIDILLITLEFLRVIRPSLIFFWLHWSSCGLSDLLCSLLNILHITYARKLNYEVRLNASRTSKRRVSYLGMSWRRNELITLTLPKSGVARTVCYVNCFVQPKANTKTYLPINNYGEYRKAPFSLFSATANRRKCLKKSKSLRRKAKRANLVWVMFTTPVS